LGEKPDSAFAWSEAGWPVQMFEDFLRKVWKDKISFEKLNIANPETLPIGPTTVIGDNVGFTRQA
jgi:hypothetical protein